MSTSTKLDRHQVRNDAVFQELATIDQRLRDLEREFNHMTDEKRSHLSAKKRDARDTLERGELKNLVVITPPEERDGSHAVSKIEGIYTFIEAGPHTLTRGDEVLVRIVDIGDNHAEAIALDRLDSRGDQ